MTLEQLRIFVAVAEREHMTAAARALNIAQSAVSHAIAALETRHDVQLFNRIGRQIELTDAGRALLADARGILAQVDHAASLLDDFGTLARGKLSIYASQTIGSYWLPRHLVAFRAAYPGVDLALHIGNSVQVAEAVADGRAELGFVEAMVAHKGLEAHSVARDQLIIVVAPEHDWATHPPRKSADLCGSLWVLREAGSGTRTVLEQALADQGLPPERLPIALELPSNEAVRGAVEAGLGATALSVSVAASSLEAGLLHHVPWALPTRAFYRLTHPGRSESRTLRAFLDLSFGSGVSGKSAPDAV